MRQTVPSDRGVTRLSVPEAEAHGFAEVRRALGTRSQLVWGEHCTECAYPACYSACSFYTPRQDLHCRRFEAGIESLDAGGLVRVRFRRWGKLEARGPAGLRSAAAAGLYEAVDGAASAAFARLPHAFVGMAARHWDRLKRDGLAAPGPTPEAFVVEHWSPTDAGGAFTLTFLQEGADRLFQTRFEVGPRYGRLVVAAPDIAQRIDLNRPYLVQIEPVGEAQGRDLVLGLADFAVFDTPLATAGEAPAKVVIWDLDETLWDGVLAEDGIEGVRPRPEALTAIRALDARGVLQSAVSKNDPDEAGAALDAFGLSDLFLHPQLSWAPKSLGVRTVAERLGLGLDSVVFIDDQAFERGEVSENLPGVRVLSETAVPGLAAHPWFDLPATPESRARRSLYQAEARRSDAAAAGRDYLAFLRGCEIGLEIATLEPRDAERAFELSQRTNQLNFTGARLGRDEAASLAIPDPRRLALSLRCQDRFGDYGLVGLAVLDPMLGRLDAFFLSCRVQRKHVEHAAFAHFCARTAALGHAEMTVRVRPSDRNRASADLLAALGFSPRTETLWARPATAPFADADIVSLSLVDRVPA